MTLERFASCALFSLLLAPMPSIAAPLEVGSLAVEQISSKGQAVILIPGLASGAWVWTDTAERLRDSHSVYLLTLPGFDGRPYDATATFESVQRDLRTLIESRHIEKPVLVGHSLGGVLSLAFATKYSGMIAGVVAVDGLPVFPGTELVTGDRNALAERTRAQMAGLNAEQFAASQQHYMKQTGSVDASTATKLAGLTSRSHPLATANFASEVMALDLRSTLGAITVPVVEISPFNAPDFTAMGLDENGKTAYYRALLSGVKNLDVVSIAPARHFVMFDQPEVFAAALDRALTAIRQ